MADADLTFVDQTVARLGRSRDALIPILQALQQHYRYLPREAMERVCELTEITPSEIAGVATFYTQFRHRPVGRHLVQVCHGTACHVKGSQRVHEAFERHLGIPAGEDTDPQGEFTIEKVACMGCCTLAPVVRIDGTTYGRVQPHEVAKLVHEHLQQQRRKAAPGRKDGRPAGVRAFQGEVRIGLGSCCQAQGSAQVHEAIGRALEQSGTPAALKRVGCVGMCHQAPLVELVTSDGQSKLFAHVAPQDAPQIVWRHFKPPGLVRRVRLWLDRWLDRLSAGEMLDVAQRHAIQREEGPVCAFLGPQRHLATESCGQLDPLDIDEYRRGGGFSALRRAIEELSPTQVIDELRASGLRGRGGAGYPASEKWAKVAATSDGTKYVICNGDEGDPGAFMDRMLLESFPYRIIEGMAIAARAVGADQGFFYIRAEYPLAVQRVREALARCRERGLLGRNILGSDFSLQLEIKEGAGAFVCGEETALIASLEGRRGMPRLRPPFPAECGLWGRPTLVNNVETYSVVPWILRHGPAAFAALGSETSKGTKVFALAGKIRRGGLIEVPMGITLRQIVEEIGGGVAEGRSFKAVQVGGPSGGCVPERLADTPVDFEALAEVGAMMGSGGLVVLDDTDCMVDVARYFLRFTQDQSCGKCTFCRVGTRRMLEILDRICAGEGKAQDLELLGTLARQIRAASVCGLGRTAPNPVLSTLRFFREEYEAHLEGRCPAGKCAALIQYRITDECVGCTLCAQHCPVDAIPFTPYFRHEIDQRKCTRCDTCRQVCPHDAVVVEPRGTTVKFESRPMPQGPVANV